jgi:hypothetical protein
LTPTSRATSSAINVCSTWRPVPTRQGEQALAGGAGKLGNSQRHLLGQLELGVVGRGRAVGILRHGGPVLVELLGGCPTPTRRQVSGGDRHFKFY